MDAVVAVVGGAFCGVAEGLVGGGDAGKAGGGSWISAVAVGVMAKGEGIELSVALGLVRAWNGWRRWGGLFDFCC